MNIFEKLRSGEPVDMIPLLRSAAVLLMRSRKQEPSFWESMQALLQARIF